MDNSFSAVSNGIFTFRETEKEGVFYFYRNDGEVLGDDYDNPMDFYSAYLLNANPCETIIMKDVYTEISEDGKILRVTLCKMGESNEGHNNTEIKNQKSSFFKKLASKIFG